MGLLERFTAKYIIQPDSRCWLWTAKDNGKYGQIRNEDGEWEYAHRVSWRLFRFARIPPRWRVLHRCDITLCVNPSHLFLGTAKRNTQDMISKGRHMHGEGHYLNKLSEEDILDIRWQADNGRRYKDIGLQYNITGVYVGQIVRRRVWKHI